MRVSSRVRRRRLFLRLSDKRCLCCGATDNLTVDHVIPLIDGGGDLWSNYQILCSTCNLAKGSLTIDFRNKTFYINPELFSAENNHKKACFKRFLRLSFPTPSSTVTSTVGLTPSIY